MTSNSSWHLNTHSHHLSDWAELTAEVFSITVPSPLHSGITTFLPKHPTVALWAPPSTPSTSHCALLPAYIPATAHVATWLPPTFPDWRDHFQLVGCIQGLEEVQDIFRTWIEELAKEESLQWTVTALHCKALKLIVRNSPKGSSLCTISTRHRFVPSYTTTRRILTYRRENGSNLVTIRSHQAQRRTRLLSEWTYRSISSYNVLVCCSSNQNTLTS